MSDSPPLTADQGQRIIELLEDILTAVKAGGVQSRGGSSAPVAYRPSGKAFTGWRAVPIPKFLKKYPEGSKMGDMAKDDIAYWGANYVPKEWKGAIQEADIAFRVALDEALADSTAGEGVTPPPRSAPSAKPAASTNTPPPARRAPPPVGGDDDVPF